MLRTILVVLALIVLIVIGLFWTGVLSWPGMNQPVQVNPVKVEMKEKTITVPAPEFTVQNSAAPAQPAPAPAPQQ